MPVKKALPGSHLDNTDDDSSPTESIIKIAQKMFMKSFAWIGIYLLGYYDFSIAWLITPLFLASFRSQWKKERDAKLSAARHAALANEKEMIESRIRVEDLPSWVFFPDKERAEWVNAIIQQLWPNVGHYTRKLIAESIEPAVKSALDGYGLTGFRFERVVLGQIPPRISGIKVYEKNVNRNEIIMDMDLVFASDCDIKFSVGKIKAKIMDFSLRGLLRVVFKPIVNDMPLIGGVQAFFLTSPEVDFDLGGIANAFDTPGLSNIIRKIVLEQIGYFMVLPHKFTMTLVESVDKKVLKCPDSDGVLRVRLHKATQLIKKDVGVLGMGKSDPYCVLTVGARSVKTERINNTVNPEWNFIADFPIEVVKGQELVLEIMDHDDPGDDEFLGRATVQTNVVAAKGEINNMWVELEDVDSGRAMLSLSWMKTSAERSKISSNSNIKEKQKLATCLLHVYIDSCKDLIVSRGSEEKPSPRVVMYVGQENQTTFPQYLNPDPVFEQGFVFLVVNPDADDLHIKVLDTSHKDKMIGSCVLRLSDIIQKEDMELQSQPFTLIGGGSIYLAAHIRALLPPNTNVLPTTPLATSKPLSPDKPETASSVKEDSKEGLKTNSGDDLLNKPSSMVHTPSVEEMVVNTMSPVVESASKDKEEMENFLNPPSTLRQRGIPETSGRKIKLSLSYDQDQCELKVIVHQASGLPGSDLPDPPDPYVKIYLLPERSKKSKRKTEVVKDTTEPVYDEMFEFAMKPNDLKKQSLEVTVVDRKGIFARSPVMGQAVVNLSNPDFLNGGVTEWFPLMDAEEDSD